MLVVAIIGLLAAIALPKFADLVIKSKEAAVRGQLGAVRSAISIYYADNEGRYPQSCYSIYFPERAPLVPKYINPMPSIQIPTVPTHLYGNSDEGNAASYVVDEMEIENPLIRRVYAYDFRNGHIAINCEHTDSKGTTWSLW
jgi:type II secretory pathway pseudopilin PulG